MIQILARAGEGRGNRTFPLDADVVQHERQGFVEREDRDQIGQIAQRNSLIQGDAQASRRKLAQG